MFADEHEKLPELSHGYIRGLIEGEGCFTFCKSGKRSNNEKYKIPAFLITMHARDLKLLNMVKNTLGLRNKIYVYDPYLKDSFRRGKKAMLIVREFGQLKNIIIPFFYKRLKGHKGEQFEEWLEKIGADPDIMPSFKLLSRLHKCGFYDKNPKFL